MVSVIIPNYNSKKMLVNCVKSVFEQGALVEAIVVDDASDDNSISLLESFIEEYEGTICKTFSYEDNKCYISYEIMQKLSDNSSGVGSLRILKNESNKGVAFSRNKAISICSGEYVAFLDADDYWDSTKLVKQLRLLEEDKAAVLCNTARELIEEDGKSTGRIIETPSRITLNMLKRTNYINCSSVLIRTDIIKKYPMEHSGAQEDYLTWLRILKDYKYAAGINEPLLKYRLTPGSKSRNKIKSAMMTYKTYKYAGYGNVRSTFMLASYTWNGIRKYTKKQNNI